MKKYSLFFGILLLSSFCVFKKRKFNNLNPQEYVFSYSIDSIEKVIYIIYDTNLVDRQLFLHFRYKGLGYKNGLKIKGQEQLRNYSLSSSGMAIRKSPLYYNKKDSLYLFENYFIILDSLSVNATKIIIKSYPKISIGKVLTYKLNEHNYLDERLLPVKPSTIEEYEIIRKIGIKLGVIDMPKINYP